MPDTGRLVALLDLCEDAKAAAYIARHFEPDEWREQVAAFRERGFLAAADEEGTPVCVAGDRDRFMEDHRRRRREEAAVAEARRAADPRRQVEHAEHTAAFARANARRYGQPERARRLTMRARLARVRLLVGRLVAPRHGGREHRAPRRRPTSRAGSRRGDPDPAGEPEPPRGRR
jgi:hypothetical protein